MSKIKICLDAGHYGKYNRSPAVPAYYESEAMWQLHLYLKEALEALGFEVKQTRLDQAKDLGVTDRGRAAKGCALLLSLHSNAVGSGVNEDINYPVVYHLAADAGTDADDRSKALALLLAPAIASAMGTRQDGRTSYRLAKTDKNKDGVLNDNYYGLLNGARQVNVPALILEHSFHTNTRSTQWLLEDANLRYLAQVEATQVAAYFGITAAEGSTADATTETDKLVVDGKWGSDTTTRLQQIFGTTVDGKISNQWATYQDSNPGLTSGWEWQEKPNGKGSQLIKAMQNWAGMPESKRDGEWGPDTCEAVQKKLGTTVDGEVSNPSQMVKALQRWANEH